MKDLLFLSCLYLMSLTALLTSSLRSKPTQLRVSRFAKASLATAESSSTSTNTIPTSTPPQNNNPNLRVAVVGGGFAGLATALKFALKGVKSVHIIDPQDGPGLGGASAAAAGMCHPLAPKGKLIWGGLEGYSATKALLDLVEAGSGLNAYTLATPLVRSLGSAKELADW
jgi:hypothetical protein